MVTKETGLLPTKEGALMKYLMMIVVCSMSMAKASGYGFSEYKAVVGSNYSENISMKKACLKADLKRLLVVQPRMNKGFFKR